MVNKKLAGGTHNTARLTKQQSDDSVDYSSLKTVLFYSSLIILLPLATFFLLKSLVLDTFFAMSDMQTNIYSAVGAVVSLHLALGLYIYRAYFGVMTEGRTKTD